MHPSYRNDVVCMSWVVHNGIRSSYILNEIIMIFELLLPISIILLDPSLDINQARKLTSEAVEYLNINSPHDVKIKRYKRAYLEQSTNTIDQFQTHGRFNSVAKWVRRHVKACRGKRKCMVLDGLMQDPNSEIKHMGGLAYICSRDWPHYGPAKIGIAFVGNGMRLNDKDSEEISKAVIAHELGHMIGAWHLNSFTLGGKYTENYNLMNTGLLSLMYSKNHSLWDVPFYKATKKDINWCYDDNH